MALLNLRTKLLALFYSNEHWQYFNINIKFLKFLLFFYNNLVRFKQILNKFQRKDPEEFMQIHGRKVPIVIDANVAKVAEDSNILRKWQGDSNILIDRFDARSHLDYIPEPKKLTNKTFFYLKLNCLYF